MWVLQRSPDRALSEANGVVELVQIDISEECGREYAWGRYVDLNQFIVESALSALS